MYRQDLSKVVTKRRDLVIFWRDGYHLCLIFKQKAGWLVGMCPHQRRIEGSALDTLGGEAHT